MRIAIIILISILVSCTSVKEVEPPVIKEESPPVKVQLTEKQELDLYFNFLKTATTYSQAKFFETKIHKIWNNSGDAQTVADMQQGLTFMENRYYQLAIANFNEVKRQSPNHPTVYAYIAFCYYMLNDVETAHKYNQKALEINPRDFFPIAGEALINLRFKKYKQALKYMRILIKIYPLWNNGSLKPNIEKIKAEILKEIT